MFGEYTFKWKNYQNSGKIYWLSVWTVKLKWTILIIKHKSFKFKKRGIKNKPLGTQIREKSISVCCITRFIIHGGKMNKISLDSLSTKVFILNICLKECPLNWCDSNYLRNELYSRECLLWTVVSYSALKWSFIAEFCNSEVHCYNFEFGSCRALVFQTVAQWVLLFKSNKGIIIRKKRSLRDIILSVLIFLPWNFFIPLTPDATLLY